MPQAIMESIPHWISALAESVTALSIILVLLQLKESHTQRKEDHDRSRREAAVECCHIWTKSLDRESSSARKLVEQFTHLQCENLEKGDRLLVDGTYLALVSSCFPERDTQLNPNGQIDLSPSETTHLRYMMVRYINTLESILATWRHNVADREIIREEFGYLFDPKKGHHLLKEFRAVLGDDNYPAIRDFEADLKSNPLRVGKPQLGQ